MEAKVIVNVSSKMRTNMQNGKCSIWHITEDTCTSRSLHVRNHQTPYINLSISLQIPPAHLNRLLITCFQQDLQLPRHPQRQLLRRRRNAGDGLQLGLQLRKGPRRRDAPFRRGILGADDQRDVSCRLHGHFLWECSRLLRIELARLGKSGGSLFLVTLPGWDKVS